LRVANDQRPAVRPKRCARAGRKRNAHALQHCFRVCSPHELTIVQQSLASTGSALQQVRLARGTGAGARSGSGLETYRLFFNDVLRHGWRLSNSGRCASTLATATGYTTADVVTDIQRTAEKFRWDVIPFRDQVVALLAERNNRNGIRFHLDL